eukprot:TRINITY_DN458_c0_g1_i1.p1 TRINITY_DN458_c0_g1~~TRINITY_DN458_c0_g1_i1.p1  ORF type:complete len:404 (-),score=113.38 TRINITY_DN458_c0_g1_i1:213-1424(-)
MSIARPVVSVFNPDNAQELVGSVAAPGVFNAPIRLDIVQFVHANIAKNTRQAHGVSTEAGMQHSAESWHPGRAVARIPRVGGSGTNRSGQGAFGNQCRKGRMFAPLKTWRRWHRKVNVTQKRHAVASAVAATFQTPLVLARGHRIEQLPELPLVVDDRVEGIEKTKDAVAFLKRFGLYQDVQRVIDSKRTRAGKGKYRYNRFKFRRGPLIVIANDNPNLIRAVRNIPGVEVNNVHRLNLRLLAPGGNLGRLVIWTKSAFQALDGLFGSHRKVALEKSGYHLQRSVLSNADISRIINSNEIQSVLRPVRETAQVVRQKKNPLRNQRFREFLNPHAEVLRKSAQARAQEASKKRDQSIRKRRGLTAQDRTAEKARKKASATWIRNVWKQLDDAAERQDKGTLATQ